MDVSRKTVLFWDASASYTHVAESVVGEFAAVLYFSPWEKGFSVSRDFLPGMGVAGVERVPDFFDALGRADLVVFSDVGMGGLQEFLRAQGMPVFGSGRASVLERDRWKLKDELRSHEIDYSDGYLIHGLDTLRRLLERQNDLYIKYSYFRGDVETYHHRSYAQSQNQLAQWALNLGPYSEVANFIVEPPIDANLCVEVGADPSWVCDGEFPSRMLWGYEDKDAGYLGTTLTVPQRMRSVLSKLSGVLSSYGYRGPLSTETKECDDGSSYVIDLACRFPEPPSSVHSFIAKNWGEMMYGAAIGQPVEPDYDAAYAVEIVLRSEAGVKHPLAVEVGIPEGVRLHGHCVFNKQDYAVSPSEIREVGAACGWSDSLPDAIEQAIAAAESVKGDEVEFDAASMRNLLDTIKDGRDLGLTWGMFSEE